MMLKTVLLILFAEVWNTVGQILFKKSTNAFGTKKLRGVSEHTRFIKDIVRKPAIWAGLIMLGIGLVVWFVALSGADLSIVSPIGSMQYILILIGAHIFLGEKINLKKTIGTFLVVAGIVLVVLS